MDTETIAVQALKEIGETSLKALARIADMRAEQSTSNVHDLLAEPLTREASGLAEPRLRYSSPWPWLLAICISAVLWVVIAVVAWLFWTLLITPAPSKPVVERTEAASEWGDPSSALARSRAFSLST